MPGATQTYRKLSSWQGIFRAGAVFVDEHSLLSVRSFGYEERVRRLLLSDIQAIVVSKSRRFGVSRWELLSALVVVVAALIVSSFNPSAARPLWGLAVGLFLAWLYIAMKASRRCRVFTAMGHEELLSIRRSWTASKFLAEITPRIEAAQGVLPADWKASVAADSPVVLAQGAAPLADSVDSKEGNQVSLPRMTG
jgi:hypothetical protein